jgi:hypothetical protein
MSQLVSHFLFVQINEDVFFSHFQEAPPLVVVTM